jgi:glycopeptide antibiotics resistance protein
MLTLGTYSLLRVAVRGIADAPNELLDERQIQIRDSSYRQAYLAMGYLILVLFLVMFFGPDLRLFEPEGNDGSFLLIASLFAFASLPSMFIAWREKDI